MRGGAGLGYGSAMLSRLAVGTLAAFFAWRIACSVTAYGTDLHATAGWREGYSADEETRTDNALAAPGGERPTAPGLWIGIVRRHVPENAHLYVLQKIEGPDGGKAISMFYQVANLLYPRLVQPIDTPRLPDRAGARGPAGPAYVLDLRRDGGPHRSWQQVASAAGARLWRVDASEK